MAFVTIDELQGQMEEDLDDAGKRQCGGALERLSALAGYYGNPKWTDITVPPVVKQIIIGAALRWWANPDAHETDRAGDEQIGHFDYGVDMAMAGFSPAEIAILKDVAGKDTGKAFGVLDLTGRGTYFGHRDIYVPVGNGEKDFPFYPQTLGRDPDGGYLTQVVIEGGE